MTAPDKNPHVTCHSCGTANLTVRVTIDPIDSKYHSLMNFIYQMTGSPIYRCAFCRLQFYDPRPLLAQPEKTRKRVRPVQDTPRGF